MRKTVSNAIAFVIFLVTSVVPPHLDAMEIFKFDKMADSDQDEYVAELVLGAQRVLKDKDKADLAEQVHKLFTEKDPEANVPTGMIQFDLSLAKSRVADLERIAKDPNAPRIEVEHAMIVVLKRSGITLPNSFMNVMKDFKPKHLPKQSDAASSADPSNAKKPPMIIRNPDGTITLQKVPPEGEGKNTKKGLVIPPQVVIPIVPTPKKRSKIEYFGLLAHSCYLDR